MKSMIVLVISIFFTLSSFAQGMFSESFRNSAVDTSWHFVEYASLSAPFDGEGEGWLRLTNVPNNWPTGAVYSNRVINFSKGGTVGFDFTIWGGSGADGMALVFYDGNESSFAIGGSGGSIGYMSTTTNAYAAVGISVYPTSFSGDAGYSNIAVRGGLNNNFPLLASHNTSTNVGFTGSGSRPNQNGSDYRRLLVTLTSDRKLSVSVIFGLGNEETLIIDSLDVSSDFPADLSNIKLALTAAYGGLSNNFEARDFSVTSVSSVAVSSADNRTTNSARLNGLVNPQKSETVVRFLYGTVNNSFTDSVTADESPLSSLDSIFKSVSANVSSLEPATQYYFAVSALNDSGYFRSSSNSFYTVAAEPTQQSTITADSVSKYSAYLSLSGGNGESRLVVISTNSEYDWSPEDLTDYNYSTNLSDANMIDSLSYVVYSGTDSSFIMTGLTDSVTYTMYVYDKNGNGSISNYLSGNPGTTSFTTLQAEFSNQQNANLAGRGNSKHAWADINDDSLMDFIYTSSDEGGAYLFIKFNNGDGTFTEEYELINLSGSTPNVSVGNLDSDPELEILFVNSNSVTVLNNNGEGFNSYDLMGSDGYQESSIALFDYDLDGDLDIMISGTMQNPGDEKAISIFKNNGDLDFTRVLTNMISVGDGELGIGDFNEDGFPDVFLTGTDTYYFAGRIAFLYLGNGTSQFTLSEQRFSGTYRGGLKVGYLNSDSHLDIVYYGAIGDGGRESHILYGDGAGNFNDDINPFTGLALSSLDIGDYDNDGDVDIIASGTPNSKTTALTFIVRNDNEGFTELQTDDFLGFYRSAVSFIDFNNDNKLDVFVSGDIPGEGGEEGPAIIGDGYLSYYALYKNKLDIPENTAPTAPEELTSTVDNNLISISWSGASDNQTVSSRLGYNLYLSTSQNEINITNPGYSLENESMTIRNSGNTYQRNNILLKNLEPGTYYYGVQSIDAGYHTSAISAVDSFIVTAQPFRPAPTGFGYNNNTDSTISLFWTGLDDEGVVQINVYEIIDGSPVLIGQGSNEGNSYSFEIDSVGYGELHYYKVAAVFEDESLSEFSKVLAAGSFNFNEETSNLPQFFYKSYKWADFNGDGYMDLAGIDGISYLRIWIFSQFSESGLPEYINQEISSDEYDNNSNIQVADIDNDNDVDIAVIADDKIKIYRNDGQGEGGYMFTELYTEYLESGSNVGNPFGLFADVNNDGFQDLLVSGFDDSYQMSILYNISDEETSRTFNRVNMPGIEALQNGAFDAADVDHDGDLDLIATGHMGEEYDRYTWLLINTEDDSARFVISDQFFTGSYKGTIKFADLNNDGHPDIISNGAATNGQRIFRTYKNDGTGTFNVMPSFIPGTAKGTFDAADINNDGLTDIVLSGTADGKGDEQIYVYMNTGNFSFTRINTGEATPFLDADINLIDLDSDGDLDIFTTGYSGEGGGGEAKVVAGKTFSKTQYVEGGASGIIWNNNAYANTAPNSPESASHTVDGNTVELLWAGATDAETPASGLQYNIFVINSMNFETEYFVFDASIPVSDDNNRNSLLGVTNAGSNTSFKLNLPLEGEYVWLVQVVDNGRMNSDILPAGSFIINSTVPVELSAFRAVQKNSSVEIQWTTQTESNNYGFEIQKQNADLSWKVLGFVKGNGTSTEEHSYQFTDRQITEKATYRLKQIDENGSFGYSALLTFAAEKPTIFELSQNYPNPFNPSTTIRYSIPLSGMVKLTVFDILGREITQLVNEVKEPGYYEIPFNAAGYSSGVYYYRVEFNGLSSIKKMTLLK